MIIENSFEQGDDKWHEARLGSVGGTGVSNIITSTGKESKSREKYLYELASHRLTGKAKSIFQTYEMAWGHQYEPEARELFSFLKEVEVSQCAMIFADESKVNHISPDGYMLNQEQGLEIKCPQLQTHDEYLSKGVLPTAYRLQVQSSLALTGWDIWWFMSYFSGVTPLIIQVKRDEPLIKIIKKETERFLADLNELVNRLKT